MITLILIIALATFGVWMTLAYLNQHDKNVKEKKRRVNAGTTERSMEG